MTTTDDAPILLDLFSCEGIGARGYRAAGFRTVGVDTVPRYASRYGAPFVAFDAIALLSLLLDGNVVRFESADGPVWLSLADFAAIHASPPCQAHSITKHTHRKAHPDLIVPTRNLLVQTGLPYVIENVPGAPLTDPVTLCWGMFNADGSVTDQDGTPLRMQRHRLFESNIPIPQPPHRPHNKAVQVAGAYGAGSSDPVYARTVRHGGYTPAKSVRERLLGVPAGEHTLYGLSQSIPPAYTEYIGRHLLAAIR